jgi:hypothetical protein
MAGIPPNPGGNNPNNPNQPVVLQPANLVQGPNGQLYQVVPANQGNGGGNNGQGPQVEPWYRSVHARDTATTALAAAGGGLATLAICYTVGRLVGLDDLSGELAVTGAGLAGGIRAYFSQSPYVRHIAGSVMTIIGVSGAVDTAGELSDLVDNYAEPVAGLTREAQSGSAMFWANVLGLCGYNALAWYRQWQRDNQDD